MFESRNSFSRIKQELNYIFETRNAVLCIVEIRSP